MDTENKNKKNTKYVETSMSDLIDQMISKATDIVIEAKAKVNDLEIKDNTEFPLRSIFESRIKAMESITPEQFNKVMGVHPFDIMESKIEAMGSITLAQFKKVMEAVMSEPTEQEIKEQEIKQNLNKEDRKNIKKIIKEIHPLDIENIETQDKLYKGIDKLNKIVGSVTSQIEQDAYVIRQIKNINFMDAKDDSNHVKKGEFSIRKGLDNIYDMVGKGE